MEPFSRIVRHKLANKDSKVPLTKDNEVIQALGPDCFHKPFCVGVKIRAARRNSYGLYFA